MKKIIRILLVVLVACVIGIFACIWFQLWEPSYFKDKLLPPFFGSAVGSLVSGIVLWYIGDRALKQSEQRKLDAEELRIKRDFYSEFMGARMFLNNSTIEQSIEWNKVANKIPAIFNETEIVNMYEKVLGGPSDDDIVNLYESIYDVVYKGADKEFNRAIVNRYLSTN